MSDARRLMNQLFGDPEAICTCDGRPRGRLEIIDSTENVARPVSAASDLPTCPVHPPCVLRIIDRRSKSNG
jgi:hypothetical protein